MMFGPRRALQSQLRHVIAHAKAQSRLKFNPTRHVGSVASPPTQSSIWTRRLAYAGLFGGLGIGTAIWLDGIFTEPSLPGTEEDMVILEEIYETFDELPIVKELRKNLDYVESNVYENYTEEDKAHRFTSGPLRGSRGLALQKVFYNEKEKKAVNVAFLGPGLEGWPTIVHGGALGTVMDENLGRVAVRSFSAGTGVTANLQLNYRAPVHSDQFYAFHATLDQEKSTDRKAFVTGEVRDATGKLCLEGSAIFVVPKHLQLQRIGDTY